MGKKRAGGKVILEVSGLVASVEGNRILEGVDLVVREGERHAIMGPNGSGKSTLANALMGHPSVTIEEGKALFDGEDLFAMTPDVRARKGLFLAFQNPVAVPGVPVASFLRQARLASHPEEKAMRPRDFFGLLERELDAIGLDPTFAARALNDGFSGGERKRLETVQLSVLKPLLAILDEPDSGLDVDALHAVAGAVDRFLTGDGRKPALVVITHYKRILDLMKPDVVHVLADGVIAMTGGPELAATIDATGYEPSLSRLIKEGAYADA